MSAIPERACGWNIQLGRVGYEKALHWQKGLVRMRKEGMARDTIIMLEHPETITVGRDGHKENYDKLQVTPHFIERGGDVTYHGPGQLVVYYIFNLTRRNRDLHLFMEQIQLGIVQALGDLGLEASTGDEYTGVWVGKQKIASIGVAVKNWVTFHGSAINLNTDLDKFQAINPCGLDSSTMISAQKLLGKKVDIEAFRTLLGSKYNEIFETDFYSVSLDELAEDIESQAGGYTI
ncbi:MAG: lipoyl(octanoyl) transferase LipB [bacterium]|nr:lipoyl(octanoyl) transferase LipB [bacterium]